MHIQMFAAMILGVGLAVVVNTQDRPLRYLNIAIAVFLSLFRLGDGLNELLLRWALFGFWMFQAGMTLLSWQSRAVEKSSRPKQPLRREIVPVCLDAETLLRMPQHSQIRALESCFREIAIVILAGQDLSFLARKNLHGTAKQLGQRAQLLPFVTEYIASQDGNGKMQVDHPIEIAYPLLIDALRGCANLAEDLVEYEGSWEQIFTERGELLAAFACVLDETYPSEPFVRRVAELWRAAHGSLENVRSISAQVSDLEQMIPDINHEIENRSQAIDAAA